ncbi:NAD-dependent epimerase/dehydratase family protein [Leifsonia sp. 2MCAF36]|uniref:NAD-dependent epimerase/dehydratase family protein n=1 Tax=Leifsonia sp. 2MCAF36 TaxID=3232988 RepID=UPI003F9C15FA
MSSPTRRAVILGGTGAMGGATAQRLARNGWIVDVTGRTSERMPVELVNSGVRFHAVDRSDARALSQLLGDGADLLVDLVAYTGSHVEEALPLYRDSGSVVVASSRAVYRDEQGRHINGDEAPRFPVPIPETNPMLPPAPAGTNPYSREGYAPCKVAVEQAARDSGLPVTVIRPSKVHGRWARNARTTAIVERMLAGADTIELTRRGESVDHLTAAANVAALIEAVADAPEARILNIADPDPLSAREIVEAIGAAIGWQGRILGLDDGVPGGEHPWNAPHPIVLDTRAATEVGYRPLAPGRALLAEEARWVASTHSL